MTNKPTLKLIGMSTEVASSVAVPFYSSRPTAGLPFLGDDSIENVLDINDLLIKNPASTFFVRVDGDSMEGVGIFSGDVLVVDRACPPKHGRIVVAAVYGEMVVKKLEQNATSTKLVSANDAYEPIVLNDNDECFVWGVVIGSVRSFL
jgi:DNA polymerase V